MIIINLIADMLDKLDTVFKSSAEEENIGTKDKVNDEADNSEKAIKETEIRNL